MKSHVEDASNGVLGHDLSLCVFESDERIVEFLLARWKSIAENHHHAEPLVTDWRRQLMTTRDHRDYHGVIFTLTSSF